MNMKSIIYLQLILLGLFVLLIGCQKDKIDDNPRDDYMSFGAITGYDWRKCMCCGGWIIEIDNSIYRFFELPDNCIINLENETFPLNVKLDWVEEDFQCLGDEIIIKKIKSLTNEKKPFNKSRPVFISSVLYKL
ncbi:MAG: hypothetical protein B6D64_02640 [Bacteroidetes bacterium 4484_276]|nr:MAG: hypothetical protein B6D64_02640 [Bacteroidetes bacterium 4484_276]